MSSIIMKKMIHWDNPRCIRVPTATCFSVRWKLNEKLCIHTHHWQFLSTFMQHFSPICKHKDNIKKKKCFTYCYSSKVQYTVTGNTSTFSVLRHLTLLQRQTLYINPLLVRQTAELIGKANYLNSFILTSLLFAV